MCLVTDHARAIKRLKELEAQIAETLPKTPVLDLLKVSRADYVAKLAPFGITPIGQNNPLDGDVFLAGMKDLERIAPDICYPADYYIAEIWDCENYAIQAMNDSARLFHVSGICLVLGDTPLGYHGFCATLDKDTGELWLLEPNSGFDYAGGWVRPSEVNYKPEKALV